MEEEIQARVEFKLNEIQETIKNQIKNHHSFSWLAIGEPALSMKHTHYMEAFKIFQGIFKKETMMAVPYDDMAVRAKGKKKDAAVDEIMKHYDFAFRGMPHRNRHSFLQVIVKAIESAQR